MIRSFTRIGAALFMVACASAPAMAQKANAAAVATARDVVIASGMTRTFDGIVPQILVQMQQVTVTRPELKGDLDEILKQIQPELAKKKEEMIAKAADIFAARFSENELKDIDTFFNSPTGKIYVEKQPAVMSELYPAMRDWTNDLSAFVIQRVREEMKKRGKEF